MDFSSLLQDSSFDSSADESEQPDQGQQAAQPPPRIIIPNAERDDPYVCMSDRDFRAVFGFNKGTCFVIEDYFREALTTRQSNSVRSVTPREKMLIFIDHARSNGFHRQTAHMSWCSRDRSTVSTIINQVALVIAQRQSDFVRLPTQEEEDEIAKGFWDLASRDCKFPGIRLLIDGSHVEIEKPSIAEAHNGRPLAYINRKGYCSLNVLVATDDKGKIRYFDSSAPGKVHDSVVLRTSPLADHLERTFNPNRPKYVLGDQGYPCLREVLTPVRDDRVNDEATRRYNRAHKGNRIRVEHHLGRLKKRFPLLLYQMRAKKLDHIQRKICACIVLHNIAVEANDDPADTTNMTDDGYQRAEARLQMDDGEVEEDMNSSFFQRNRVIDRFFTN